MLLSSHDTAEAAGSRAIAAGDCCGGSIEREGAKSKRKVRSGIRTPRTRREAFHMWGGLTSLWGGASAETYVQSPSESISRTP